MLFTPLLYTLSFLIHSSSVADHFEYVIVRITLSLFLLFKMNYNATLFCLFVYRPGNGSKYYGDFAQILWAKSNMVGCGRSRFKVSEVIFESFNNNLKLRNPKIHL